MIALLLGLALADEGGWVRLDEPVMATTIEVMVPTGRAAAAEDVWAAFREVEAEASEWRADSPLGRLNASAGGPGVVLPADLCAMLRRSLAIGDATDGAFDVSWAALWDLWDFHAVPPHVPSDAAIAARVPLVDHRRVQLDDACLASLPVAGMKVGLGGIAKGWALDRAARRLEAAGVASWSVSAGGQVSVHGLKDGRPWSIGLRDPRGPRDDAFAVLRVTDASVSTSGDYERWFEVDGVRYHHILDPRTGRPTTQLRSATVIAPDGTTADALSTALMVLGLDGLRVLAAFPGVEAVVVDTAGGVHATPGVLDDLTLLHAPRP